MAIIIPGTGFGKSLRIPAGATAAATNPFTDGTASGGVIYWDAAVQTGYSNGDPVGAFTNSMPGGTITMTQTLTERPSWVASVGPNNRPAAQFDGVNDRMIFSAEPLPTGTGGVSVYAYCSWAGEYGQVYNLGGSAGSYDNSHGLICSSSTLFSFGYNPQANPTSTGMLGPRYATANRYGSASRTGWVRGGETLSSTAAGTASVTSGSSFIGSYGAGNYFQGNLMGFAVYTGVHSDAVTTSLLNYWITLFG